MFITRAQWGARPPRRVSRSISPQGITVHWGGPSPWRNGIGDHSQCAGLVRGWQNFHMDGRGWSDIAYNFVVCPHGHIFEGRWAGVRSAANGTNNGNYLSYAGCYLGGVGDPFTDEAKSGFNQAAQILGLPINKVHSDWKATGCPGPQQTAWVRSGSTGSDSVPTPAPPTEDSTTQGVDMYIAVHGVGFFAQVGNVTVPLNGIDLAEFGEIVKSADCPVMVIPQAAAADWNAKVMQQTRVATGG